MEILSSSTSSKIRENSNDLKSSKNEFDFLNNDNNNNKNNNNNNNLNNNYLNNNNDNINNIYDPLLNNPKREEETEEKSIYFKKEKEENSEQKQKWIVSFESSTKVGNFISNYIVYLFTIYHGPNTYTVEYRYSELYEFHINLDSKYLKDSPEFPEKNTFKIQTEDFIKERATQLETYLQFIFNHKKLRKKILEIKKISLTENKNINQRKQFESSTQNNNNQKRKKKFEDIENNFSIPDFDHLPHIIQIPFREDIYLKPVLEHIFSTLIFFDKIKKKFEDIENNFEEKRRIYEKYRSKIYNEARTLSQELNLLNGLIKIPEILKYEFICDYLDIVILKINKALKWQNDYEVKLISELPNSPPKVGGSTFLREEKEEKKKLQKSQKSEINQPKNNAIKPKKKFNLNFEKLSQDKEKRISQYRELAEFLLVADDYDEKRREELKVEFVSQMKKDFTLLEKENRKENQDYLNQMEEIASFLGVEIKTLLKPPDLIKKYEVQLFHCLDDFNKLNADDNSQVLILKKKLISISKDIVNLRISLKNSNDPLKEKYLLNIEDLQENLLDLEHHIEKILMKEPSSLQVNKKIQKSHEKLESDLFEL